MIRQEELLGGWEVRNLNEVLDTIENGNRPKGGIKNIQEGILSIGAEHLTKDGSFDFKNIRLISEDFFILMNRGIVKKGDVLIVKDGATTGKTAFVSETFPYEKASVNEHIFILRGKNEILNQKFLYYYLRSPEGQSKILATFHGAAIGGINTQFAKKVKVPIPPLETQKKIVSILEKAEAAKQIRREADIRMKDYLNSAFLEMFGDPIKNPQDWKILKFSKVGKLERGRSKNRPRNAPELLGGKYPLIQTGDVANSDNYIRNFTQTYSELGLHQSKMWPKRTLCITIAANIAKTGILTFDACFPDSIVGFTPNDSVTTEYVQFWLSFLQKNLEETAPESAQKNINLKILSNLNIPTPPIELQNKFTQIVKNIEYMKMSQKQSAQQINFLFNSLIQKAFRGELVA